MNFGNKTKETQVVQVLAWGRPGKPSRGSKDDQLRAKFNGKLITLDVYTMKRRFNFLHMYAGVNDPLGHHQRRSSSPPDEGDSDFM